MWWKMYKNAVNAAEQIWWMNLWTFLNLIRYIFLFWWLFFVIFKGRLKHSRVYSFQRLPRSIKLPFTIILWRSGKKCVGNSQKKKKHSRGKKEQKNVVTWRFQSNPPTLTPPESRQWYSSVVSSITSITGHTTVVGSRAIRSTSGSSHPSVHSQWLSRYVRTGAVAASAPRRRALIRPSRFFALIILTFG